MFLIKLHLELGNLKLGNYILKKKKKTVTDDMSFLLLIFGGQIVMSMKIQLNTS